VFRAIARFAQQLQVSRPVRAATRQRLDVVDMTIAMKFRPTTWHGAAIALCHSDARNVVAGMRPLSVTLVGLAIAHV
jgi:hypothetical protein